MGNILEKVRRAVKEGNEQKSKEEKELFRLSGTDEDKIREFETRLENVKNIMSMLESGEIKTEDIKREIREEMREIA